jgi:hypothetical protein
MTKRPGWGVEDNNPAGESPREEAGSKDELHRLMRD